jgi:hypothetical protein
MAKLTVIFGTLLVLVGIGFYVGLAVAQGQSPSPTALIPAAAGIPIFFSGLLAFRDKYRMHAMHVVAVLTLLGCALPAGRLAMQLARGRELNPVAATSQALMAALCGILLVLCVKSFIDARRRRAAVPAESDSTE